MLFKKSYQANASRLSLGSNVISKNPAFPGLKYLSCITESQLRPSVHRLPDQAYSSFSFLQVTELAASAEQLSQERFRIEAMKEMEEENISNRLQRQIEYLVSYVKVYMIRSIHPAG